LREKDKKDKALAAARKRGRGGWPRFWLVKAGTGGTGASSGGDGVDDVCTMTSTLKLAACVDEEEEQALENTEGEESLGNTEGCFVGRVLMRPPTVLQLPLEGWECERWKDR
jgi:hypothetical protein